MYELTIYRSIDSANRVKEGKGMVVVGKLRGKRVKKKRKKQEASDAFGTFCLFVDRS